MVGIITNGFRSKEAIPKRPKDLLQAAQVAYENFGVIHNVIDLMADFATQGIKLVHGNSKVQKVCREWAKKVNLEERSERFLNLLYRLRYCCCASVLPLN